MNGEFGGDAKDVWYVFKRAGMLHVGTIPLKQWEEIGKNDLDDDQYQQAIQSYQGAPASKKDAITSSFPRNVKLANEVLEAAGFKCFNDPGHTTFETPAGNQYMEAHHIIPISRQGEFKDISIDHAHNIVSLCPTCHKQIHLGLKSAKKVLLEKLHADRKAFFALKQIAVDLTRLKEMY